MPTPEASVGATFRDLALALSDDERRSLLRKINASLSLVSESKRPHLRPGYEEPSRRDVIMEEIEALTFWQRLRFFIRKLLSARGSEQAYIEFRLADLRRRARHVMPALRGLEFHSVPGAVAAAVWELYRAAYPVIPVFLDLWRTHTYLHAAVEHLLSERVPSARSTLFDFTALEELQETFLKSELKGDVRKMVVDRLQSYIDQIPEDVFTHLEAGLLPFYHLRQLCLFDFDEAFRVFGYDPGLAPPEAVPPFRDAPASAARPVMESLYYGLHSSARLEAGFPLHTEILDRYLELKDLEQPETQPKTEPASGASAPLERVAPSEEAGADAARQAAYRSRQPRIEELRGQIRELHVAARTLARSVPLAELIRYYARDPWRAISPYVPKLKLREFYRSYLMLGLLTQLDQHFPEVRRGVVRRMTRELFGGDPPPLDHFRTGVQLTPDRAGLPSFTHIHSVTLALNFLRHVYRGRMQEMVRILSRILSVRQRDSSSDLVAHVSGTEEAWANLEDFDESFSPESDDGKAYLRIRYGVETDLSLHRSFRSVVGQRDREAGMLADAAAEHLRGLNAVFATVRRNLTDQIRERYAEADVRANRLNGLDQLLETYRGRLTLFERLMRQTRAMEEGY